MQNPLIIIFFLCLGGSLPLIWLIIYSRTHQREIKSKLASGQPNTPYSEKLAPNYSPKEKRWALFTGICALVLASFGLIFLLSGHSLLAGLILALLPPCTIGLVFLGNRTTK